ncbi:hypothetical protein G9A89_019255 [Geosiphon pyriformis]|nr:hypothetical protein G9A89_019255 [Geosiphon pyriformis]
MGQKMSTTGQSKTLKPRLRGRLKPSKNAVGHVGPEDPNGKPVFLFSAYADSSLHQIIQRATKIEGVRVWYEEEYISKIPQFIYVTTEQFQLRFFVSALTCRPLTMFFYDHFKFGTDHQTSPATQAQSSNCNPPHFIYYMDGNTNLVKSYIANRDRYRSDPENLSPYAKEFLFQLSDIQFCLHQTINLEKLVHNNIPAAITILVNNPHPAFTQSYVLDLLGLQKYQSRNNLVRIMAINKESPKFDLVNLISIIGNDRINGNELRNVDDDEESDLLGDLGHWLPDDNIHLENAGELYPEVAKGMECYMWRVKQTLPKLQARPYHWIEPLSVGISNRPKKTRCPLLWSPWRKK